MKPIRAFFLLLVLLSLACQMPVRTATQETTPIPVTTEAAGEFEKQMATAAAVLEETGQVTVTITDTQLTSFIAQQLATNSEAMLTEPQVALRDGTVEVTGIATVGSLSADAIVILQPFADQGNLRFSILDAQFGAIPIPDPILATLTETLNQNLDYFTTVNGRKFWLETISVDYRSMTLSGRLD